MELLHQSGTLTFFLKSFVSLFVIVNALGNAPIWATMLQRFDEDERRLIVRKAVLVGFAALLVVTLTGTFFFKLLGIQL